MELIRNIIGGANGILWGAPMLALMLISGGLFTVRTGFFQLRHPLYILRRTVLSRDCRNAAEGSVTPFQAMSSALAATLGTGNIAGVAAALASGGPGAVFWLWISAMMAPGEAAAKGSAAQCTISGTDFRKTASQSR